MDETPWRQVNITYPGKTPDERERRAVAHLARILPAAEADGLVTGWWFIRKGAWRIRYRLSDEMLREGIDPVLPSLTDGMTWTSDIYEPETHAFGGDDSMNITHVLFHADSRHQLDFLANGPADRRECSLLLLTAFMRATGLEPNEQGDVWARAAEQRTLPLKELPGQEAWAAFTSDVRQFLTGTARPQAFSNAWLNAFEHAGRRLRGIRENGRLTRGIRAISALHVIFHWNRLGLPSATQALLSRAAKDAIFGPLSDASCVSARP